MRVHDVGHEARHVAEADARGDPCQRTEAKRVVGPIAAVGPRIGIAGAIEKVRGVEDHEIEIAGARDEHARRAAEEIVERQNLLRLANRRLDRRIAGHQRDHFGAELAQRARQRAGHVGETAGLHQRIDFRDHRQNLAGRCFRGGDHVDGGFGAGHRPSLSIMDRVIRQMPLSVRRNRSASSSGSSPTTSPAGMRTPRSMITLVSRAERSIST